MIVPAPQQRNAALDALRKIRKLERGASREAFPRRAWERSRKPYLHGRHGFLCRDEEAILTGVASRILLTRMQDAHNLNVVRHLINDEIVGAYHNLSSAGRAAFAIQVWMPTKRRCSFHDGLVKCSRRFKFRSPMYFRIFESSTRALGRHLICICAFAHRFHQGIHFLHHLLMRNTRTRIIERGLYFGPKPAVITRSLLLGIKIRNNRA